MGRRISKYTVVYGDYFGGEYVHYVRLAPLETKQFPHGIALMTPCHTKSEAERFADLVDEYIEQAFKLKSGGK